MQLIDSVTFREAAAQLQTSSSTFRPRHRVSRREPVAAASPRTERTWGITEFRVLEAAVDLYANRLRSDHAALDYMTGRGFQTPLLQKYRVGFAAGDELVAYLRWCKLPLGAAVRVGLLSSNGREFFAGRVVIPEMRSGRPIWLIGRTLQEPNGEQGPDPTYLGLPGRKPLLGWEDAIQDKRGVCIVEGPMDLLALRQCGVPGLALTGTFPAPDKLAHLECFDRLYLALDSDEAGDKGAEQLMARFGDRALRIQLPHGVKDPGDLLRRPDGGLLFGEAILHAIHTTPRLSIPASIRLAASAA